MTADEEYVSSHWERAEACPHPDRKRHCISLGGRNFTRTTVPETISGYADSEIEAWSAAATFTRTRLQQIAELGEEIALVKMLIRVRQQAGPSEDAACNRIVPRLELAKAELARGMRPPAPQKEK